MIRHQKSIGPDYFEAIFQGDDDPWDIATSAYEHEKHAHSLAVIDGQHYPNALEIGCATGVFTQKLAPLCGRLLSLDVSDTALSLARRRCAEFSNISFARKIFPQETPDGQFDLIIISEVAYYWDDEDIHRTSQWVRNALKNQAILLLTHWTGETDYPQSGDQAVEKLQAEMGNIIHIKCAERRPQYRLDLWQKNS